MLSNSVNSERTDEYFKAFNREKTLKYILSETSPIIFDVGTNIGDTLKEFKPWWPDSTVHCFEPQHECWDSLEKHQSQFDLDEVIVEKFAVGNVSTDSAVFYTHDITSGQSGFHKINKHSSDSIDLTKLQKLGKEEVDRYAKTINHERSVKIIRLDDYMSSKNIEHVDLLKIDTQGFEPEVLEGFGDKLTNVDVVITELMLFDYYERGLSFSDIEKYLLPAGFHLYDINHISKNPMNGRTDWVDVIYVNERVRGK